METIIIEDIKYEIPEKVSEYIHLLARDKTRLENLRKAEKASLSSPSSDGLGQLVTLQEQYIAFIGEELEETAILASARGWKSKRFDEGVKLRTEMERFKGKLA